MERASAMDADPRIGHVRRAVIASAVGTAIEWYDFFLYGVAAALVFPHKFFPESDPYVGTLLAFSTYFMGFLARPVGAAIFGHYGDRIGRKATLVATLVLMGTCTAGIGLVPDYATIGIWGPVLLSLGRVLQGIGVGGEWGGSVLLAAEWGDRRHRGFVTSWPQWGAPVGLLLANGAVAAMTQVSGVGFLDWGWRVPFVASVGLVGVGLYIRVGIVETPAFARLVAEARVERAPVVEVLRRNGREVLLTALLRTGQQTPFYVFTTYVLTYGTMELGMARSTLLGAVMAAAAVSMLTIPLWGHVSDRIGRRRVTVLGCLVMAAWGMVYFVLLDSGAPVLVFLAVVVALPIHDMQYGPQAAVIAESFPTRLRYSGSSLGYQLASVTAGGPAPIVALWLFERFHTSLAVGAYVSASALVSLVAILLLPDRSSVELEAD